MSGYDNPATDAPERWEALGLDGEAFMRQYLATALWSSIDPDSEFDSTLGENMSDQYGPEDFHPLHAERLELAALAWAEANAGDVRAYLAAGRDVTDLAHDLWLTENGHGAGFWDRGLGALGDRMAERCARRGSIDIHGAAGAVYADFNEHDDIREAWNAAGTNNGASATKEA